MLLKYHHDINSCLPPQHLMELGGAEPYCSMLLGVLSPQFD